MTGNKEMLYWHSQEEWYVYDEESDTYSIKNDAPERVKKSFDMWKNSTDDR